MHYLIFVYFSCYLRLSLGLNNCEDVISDDAYTKYASLRRELARNQSNEELVQETSLTTKDILPKNASLYVKKSPPTICDNPAVVTFHITVLSLNTISESEMTYVLDFYLTEVWNDNRLRYPNTTRLYRMLSTDWLQDLWMPDTVFKNARDIQFHKTTVPNNYMLMFYDSSIVYVIKLTTVLVCKMQFQTYPHDTQICELEIESMSYLSDELQFRWDSMKPVTFSSDNVSTPQYDLIKNETGRCTSVYFSGDYACIKVMFHLRRRLKYHLLHSYFPSSMIVILSWINFWMKPRDVGPRIAIGLTTILTLATINTQAQETLPQVSYVKAIDVWMYTCALFLFTSILEYGLVYHLEHHLVFDSSISENLKENGETKYSITAHNIDRVSRLLFPVAFIVFNIIYWTMHL